MIEKTYAPQPSSLSLTAVNLTGFKLFFFLKFAVFLSAAPKLKVPLHAACPGLLIKPVSLGVCCRGFSPHSGGNQSVLPGFFTPNPPPITRIPCSIFSHWIKNVRGSLAREKLEG